MKKLLALLIACLALTIAACGGDDDDDDGGGTAGGTTTTEQTDTGPPGGGAGGGGGEAVTVDIPSISFDPAEVTVTAGSTVTWTNTDDLPHTVTKESGPGPEFDSGDLAAGSGEFEQTFDQKGTIEYVCTIHPGQAGTVIVE